MKMICDVVPHVGMKVISKIGTRGVIVECNTDKIRGKTPSDDADQFISISWENGNKSCIYHFLADNILVRDDVCDC